MALISPFLIATLLTPSAHAIPAPPQRAPLYHVAGEQWERATSADLPVEVAKALEQIDRSGRRGAYGLASIMVFKRSRIGLYPWDPQSVEIGHLSSLLKFSAQYFSGLGERMFPKRAKKLFLSEMEVYNHLKEISVKDLTSEFSATEEDPAKNEKAIRTVGKFLKEKFFARPEQKTLEVLVSEASFDETLEREPLLYISDRWGVALLRRHKVLRPIGKQQMAGRDESYQPKYSTR